MSALSYDEYPATPGLRSLVAGYWCFRAGPASAARGHAIIPDGCISLAFVRAPGRRPPVVVGPRATVLYVPIEPGTCVFGVRFRPECGGLMLQAAAADLRDAVVPLAYAAPRLAAALDPATAGADDEPIAACDALLDAWSRPLAAGRDVVMGGVVDAVIASAGRLRLGEATAIAGVGPRQLQRRFRRAVGLSFKEYGRIRRFRTAALSLLIHDPPVAQLAAATGFADQSHLIRESARLAGLSPRALRGYLADIRHGPLLH